MTTMRTVLVVAVFLPAALAGCFSDDADDGDGTAHADAFGAPTAVAGEAVPPGCDLDRPAFVHGPGGVPIEGWSGPVGIPCLVTTPWGSYEPSLGLTSDGTLFLYPAFGAEVDLPAGGQFTGLGAARSMDEGETFTRHTSRVGPVNYHPYTADPFLYVDPYTDRIFMEDLAIPPFNCANLSFSDDTGETWTQTLGGCLVWDHVGYGSGPPTVSDPDYPVVIQRCAITYFLTTLASEATGCQKSLDGGMTWEVPGEPAFFGGPDGLPYVPSTCHGAAHHVFVDHRGWTWLGRGWCGDGPYVALSKDEGATWTRHHIASSPVAGHDVGIGVDPAGNVFALWVAADDVMPYMAVSRDDGATWSEPLLVSPPQVTSAGSVSIAPGGVGKAGIMYAATLEGVDGVHAVVASAYRLDGDREGDGPVFQTAIATAADGPLAAGGCDSASGTCSGQADFLDGTVGPDGTPWGSFVQDGLVAAGRLWGAPSLWDDDDPNGPYGGAAE